MRRVRIISNMMLQSFAGLIWLAGEISDPREVPACLRPLGSVRKRVQERAVVQGSNVQLTSVHKIVSRPQKSHRVPPRAEVVSAKFVDSVGNRGVILHPGIRINQ